MGPISFIRCPMNDYFIFGIVCANEKFGTDANGNGSLVKVLTMDETSARVRGEIKSV